MFAVRIDHRTVVYQNGTSPTDEIYGGYRTIEEAGEDLKRKGWQKRPDDKVFWKRYPSCTNLAMYATIFELNPLPTELKDRAAHDH